MVEEAVREELHVNVLLAVWLGLGDGGLGETLAVTFCDVLWVVVNDVVKVVVCVWDCVGTCDGDLVMDPDSDDEKRGERVSDKLGLRLPVQVKEVVPLFETLSKTVEVGLKEGVVVWVGSLRLWVGLLLPEAHALTDPLRVGEIEMVLLGENVPVVIVGVREQVMAALSEWVTVGLQVAVGVELPNEAVEADWVIDGVWL